MSYFNFENNNIFYKECGKGDPLILIHGDSASSRMFMPELKFYSKNFRTIIVDLIGQGKSQRVTKLPLDYWNANGKMIAALCRHIGINKVNMIGTSGGAIVALNAVIHAPELFNKVIADSFIGEKLTLEFAEQTIKERENSKKKISSKIFWFMMHGHDWRYVVDQNTLLISEFSKEIGSFFHKDISSIKNEVLITGSRKDDLIPDIENILKGINSKIENSKLVIFERGNHPAMLSNIKEFRNIVLDFFNK